MCKKRRSRKKENRAAILEDSGAALRDCIFLLAPLTVFRVLFIAGMTGIDAGGYRGGRLAGVDAGHEAEHENGGSAGLFTGGAAFPDAISRTPGRLGYGSRGRRFDGTFRLFGAVPYPGSFIRGIISYF